MLQLHTRVSWCIDAAAVTEKPRSCRRLLSDHPVAFGRARAVVLARPTLAPRSLFPPAMASVASVVSPALTSRRSSGSRGVGGSAFGSSRCRGPRASAASDATRTPPRTPPLSASRDRTQTAPRLRPPQEARPRGARARASRARARVVRRRLRPPTRFPRRRRARRHRGGPRRRARPGRRGPRRLPARRAQLRVRHVRARGGRCARRRETPGTPRPVFAGARRADDHASPRCLPRGGDPDPRRVHLRPISRGTPLLVRCAWTRRAARRSPCSARSPTPIALRHEKLD